MLDQIKKLRAEVAQYPVKNPEELETFRLKFIARKGAIAALFTELRHREPTERKTAGRLLNALKAMAQERFKTLARQLSTPSQANPDWAQADLTLPPLTDALGTLHPLTIVKARIIALLERIGFNMAEGPEIEDDWHNFGALNFPPNHPARDMLDTFFVAQGRDSVLRTHTSSVQIRMAERQQPPIRIISAGRVYRHETISARAHCTFQQVEGCYINRDVSFAELKQTLLYFVKGLFGADSKIRLRPSYFPFTEPSTEVDMSCQSCNSQGCSLCKHTGWVEIMGAGMVDPKVLQNCHIDPATYTGFAFGMGLERIAMLLYQVPDLRLFMENDVRFLKQFTTYA
ncbi:MAG: phenylalanine--tRNA ligase subunit alpha [Bacteroidota bacterium]